MSSFVHLCLHSEYSLLDSVIRIPRLLERLREHGMPAVALTDHSNLFGMIKFYRAAEQAGIKPIIGADVELAPDADNPGGHRLILLCQNRTGYRNLCRLLTHAYLQSDSRERHWIDRRELFSRQQGLIALSGGIRGDIGQSLLLTGQTQKAARILEHYLRCFEDRFALQISRIGHTGEAEYERCLIELANRSGCPVVATNDACFLDPEDHTAHEARVCIHEGRILSDQRRQAGHTPQQYLRSAAEMAELFSDMPHVLENTVRIAERCNLELEFGRYTLPAFPDSGGQSEAGFLSDKAAQGLRVRLEETGAAPGCRPEVYRERLRHELDVINAMGFPGYFLIVADFVAWAKQNAIPVGPGRGSGAGSVVAWALGITDLDPLRYDLLFERFLNPERVSMPDFDIDFCMEQRDRVIDYVASRYGHDQVSQIITFGRMNAKAVVRDCGRVLGYPYPFVDGVARLIPPDLNMTLEMALEQEPHLAERCRQEEDVGNIIGLARKLEGLARNAGRHAGGLVIAPGPLTDYTALYAEPGGGTVTQLDKDDIEAIGLVKFDFLGLRTLTLIQWALDSINARRAASGEPALAMNKLPLDDKETFRLLQECRTTAVFQLESRGMRELMRKLQPDSFEEIVALVALFRPGPLESGMAVEYIQRKHGEKRVSYPHPSLEPILEPTYGVILYQEQVMQIARVMAGYSLGAADLLRRAMGKKQEQEMLRQRDIFVQGAEHKGIDRRLANSVFDQMETFARYGFNKSHSAAYALLAYQTAWLKAHYPAEFMAAVLSAELDNQDKIAGLIEDCRRLGIDILPPDVMQSAYRFTVEHGAIRYGLGAIKGVGQAAVEAMIASRPGQGFKDLADFCARQDLQTVTRRTIEALIKAGAFHFGDRHPAGLLAELDHAWQAAEQIRRDRDAGQSGLFGEDPAGVLPARAKVTGGDQECPDWNEADRLQAEYEALGLYLTGHPLDQWRQELQRFCTATLDELPRGGQAASRQGNNRQPVTIAALIMAIRRLPGRGAFIAVDDGRARVEVQVPEELYDATESLLEKNRIVVIRGEAGPDRFSDELRVVARELMSLPEARQRLASCLQLRVCDAEGTLPASLQQLIRPHAHGQARVIADLSNAHFRVRLRFPENWKVSPGPGLLEALDRLPGVEYELHYDRPANSSH